MGCKRHSVRNYIALFQGCDEIFFSAFICIVQSLFDYPGSRRPDKLLAAFGIDLLGKRFGGRNVFINIFAPYILRIVGKAQIEMSF